MATSRWSEAVAAMRRAPKRVLRATFPSKRLLSRGDEAERQVGLLQGEIAAHRARLEERDETIRALEQSPRRREYELPAFAHWGEDQIVGFYLKNVVNGFYVDVGCYHPSLFSNTKLLYDGGWRGINIDPNPFMIEAFQRERPDDKNLCMAIGAEEGVVELISFGDWASSNTLSPDFAGHIMSQQRVDVAQRIRTVVRPLADVLSEHLGDGRIDFMNIDVESLDLQVLESNDWTRFRPKLVAIEDFEFDFARPTSSAVYEFLIAQGYRMVSRCVYTSFFMDGPADPSLPSPP